ncbi:MAG: hydroxyacylglutathione hydrolase [Methylotetracoccus sp.]|jgi:hydroxyacylglutathione hydrolase|nr:hydroxyacylglutathione hydrolase [Methylotetracoccus sp.]
MLQVQQIPALSDNYIYLIHEPVTGATAAVDPAEAEAVLEVLAARAWNLTVILNTHHHSDHVGGNLALKQRTGCAIVGSHWDRERGRIPGIDRGIGDGDVIPLGRASARVLSVPGHTLGHVAYQFANEALLFCGDTLFGMGCGRLFEGSAEQMWTSLSKLRGLPPHTMVYCAHEYTEANGRFALSLEPGNADLIARMRDVEALRRHGRPTVPFTLAEEMVTNPFLRPQSPPLRAALGLMDADDGEVFAEIRRRKDGFRG